MSFSRRAFLELAAAAAAASSAGALIGRIPSVKHPKKILILGGTGFLGPATVEAALARGHEITIFHRGKTRPGYFKGKVTELNGDRDPLKGDGLKALGAGSWDAVIDNSGYYPRMVKASAELLGPRIKQYLYISSISCYKEPNPENGDEDAPVATIPDPTVESMGKDYANYGALKALCEQAAEKAMPGRAAIIRPGFIVGPDDPSGRFTYWPARFDRGGEVAVPGHATDPLQLIDVRDLAEWLVKLVEDGTVGRFNATGPDRRMGWGEVVQACQKASGASSTLTWISPAFLVKQERLEFPIWAPYEGDTQGFHTWRNARALKAGLRFRPIGATAKDTLAWFKTQEKLEKGRNKLAGPTAEAEAKLLAAWHESLKVKAG